MPVLFIASVLFLLAAPTLCGQENGRLAAQKSRGIDLIEHGKFQEAAGILEGVWEQNQTDYKVAEFLAIAYLDGDREPAKAEPLLEKAIALGGQATFLVQHSHEKLHVLTGSTITEFCSGHLSINSGHLSYVADNPDHSIQVSAAEIRSFKAVHDNSQGLFVLSLTNKKTYTFRPRSWSPKETQLLSAFVKKYVTHSD